MMPANERLCAQSHQEQFKTRPRGWGYLVKHSRRNRARLSTTFWWSLHSFVRCTWVTINMNDGIVEMKLIPIIGLKMHLGRTRQRKTVANLSAPLESAGRFPAPLGQV